MTQTVAPRAMIAAVYAASFLQGMVMLSFAASSSVLKERLGITDPQYGAIFIPMVILAALGATLGGTLARALGLRRLLVLGFLGSALSQAALAGAERAGSPFPIVLLGSGLMGLGAGLAAAPLNAYPQLFFPSRTDAAVVAVYALMGLGLAGAPLLVTAAQASGSWTLFPLALLTACLAVTAWALRTPLPEPPSSKEVRPEAAWPIASTTFWLFTAIAVLYAFAEASFSNWAVLYLHEDKGLPQPVAGLALSTFWLTLSAGRVLITALTLRVSGQRVWLVLPALQGAAFLLLPGADTAAAAFAIFGLAGLACSAFFPLTVAQASQRFPGREATVSAGVFAALALGVGGASFALGALRSSLGLTQVYRLCVACPAAALVLALVVTGRARVPSRPT